MKALTLITAAALTTFSVSAAAQMNSTPAEFRGYKACVEANEEGLRGLVTERNYLYENTNDGRKYYINATIWEDGERVAVGFTCETTRSGRLLENQGLSYNHFAPAGDAPQVAGN